MDLELEDVPVHSLVPEPLRGLASPDDFLARLPEFDGDLAQQLAAAEAAGECLRFVGAPRCKPRRAIELECCQWRVTGCSEVRCLSSGSGRWQVRCVALRAAQSRVASGAKPA